MVSWPNPKNCFLSLVVNGFKRRSKAIKHKTKNLTFDRVTERKEDNSEFEKIEIEATNLGGNSQFRIFIWEDRWIWIDARCLGKNGWVWEWTRDGRLIAEDKQRVIVTAFEQSLMVLYEENSQIVFELDAIWKPLLSSKLKIV